MHDKGVCQVCGIRPYKKDGFLVVQFEGKDIINNLGDQNFIPDPEWLENLNVHHICYRIGKEPWEYENNELVTLCSECHKKIHSENEIPILNGEGVIINHANTCTRCEGYGYIPKYYHVQEGICFECWGEGVLLDNI